MKRPAAVRNVPGWIRSTISPPSEHRAGANGPGPGPFRERGVVIGPGHDRFDIALRLVPDDYAMVDPTPNLLAEGSKEIRAVATLALTPRDERFPYGLKSAVDIMGHIGEPMRLTESKCR